MTETYTFTDARGNELKDIYYAMTRPISRENVISKYRACTQDTSVTWDIQFCSELDQIALMYRSDIISHCLFPHVQFAMLMVEHNTPRVHLKVAYSKSNQRHVAGADMPWLQYMNSRKATTDGVCQASASCTKPNGCIGLTKSPCISASMTMNRDAFLSDIVESDYLLVANLWAQVNWVRYTWLP